MGDKREAWSANFATAALKAAELLRKQNIELAVVNMPWLNVVDDGWLASLVQPFRAIAAVGDHCDVGASAISSLRV